MLLFLEVNCHRNLSDWMKIVANCINAFVPFIALTVLELCSGNVCQGRNSGR